MSPATGTPDCAAALGFDPSRLAGLGERLRADAAAGTIPGAVVVLARRGRMAWQLAVGSTGTGAMQPDTLFRIAAMTRPVTVAAALALADAGRLILSDPVARWLPGFADLRVGVEQDGRLALVPARRPMTVGDFFWGSALGTCFWADPARGLQCVLMLQENDATLRAHYRAWLRQGVYGALLRQDTP